MMLRIAFAVIMLATALGEPRQAVGPTKNVASPATTTIPVAVIPLPATPAGPLDTAEKILKIAAYIVGAAWIYFNYFRGRTYHARLEPHVTAELCRRTTPEFVKAIATLKNVGLSRVPLRPDGTALRLFVFDASSPDRWKQQTTVEVFQRHQWVEPGETIEDHILVPIDLRLVPAVRVHLVIGSKPSLWSRKFMWSAIAVAT